MKYEIRTYTLTKPELLAYVFLGKERNQVNYVFLSEPIQYLRDIISQQRTILDMLENSQSLEDKLYVQDKTYVVEGYLDMNNTLKFLELDYTLEGFIFYRSVDYKQQNTSVILKYLQSKHT